MHDEGPSPDDIRRFSRETAYCPDCGEEIWDALNTCPRCGSYIPEGPSRHRPIDRYFRQKWIVVVIVLVLVGFLWFLL